MQYFCYWFRAKYQHYLASSGATVTVVPHTGQVMASSLHGRHSYNAHPAGNTPTYLTQAAMQPYGDPASSRTEQEQVYMNGQDTESVYNESVKYYVLDSAESEHHAQ